MAKLTKAVLKKIIREELLKEGLKDDYKQFQSEVSKTESGWKKRMEELDNRENSVNSVRQAQRAPVSEALGTVKKAHVKKFERALGVMESILEDTNGWLDENN